MRSRGQHGAVGPLSLARHLLHPVRARRLPPHHLFPRPARRARRLHRAHRGRPRRRRRCCSPTAIRSRAATFPAPAGIAPMWHDPHPKPSYLFALVGGNLACVPRQLHHRVGPQGRARHLCRARQGRPLRLGHGVAEARHALGRGALRPRIRSRRVQHRRGQRLQHGGDGEQGPQHLQRQARAGAARHRHRRRLRRASRASSRTNISTTGPATASPAATGSSSASRRA